MAAEATMEMVTKRGGEAGLRACVWGLHVAVSVVAVFSLCCDGFRWWVDLRMLGGAGAMVVEMVWVGTVLVVPWCAGPRLAGGWGRAQWVHGGWSRRWAGRLLWPTYFFVVCLLANTAYYYWLGEQGRIDETGLAPITLVGAVVLMGWALGTRRWVGRAERMATGVAGRGTQIGALVYGLLVAVIASGFFLMYAYARPVTEAVDVAVVLGNKVMPDGTASVTLRNRTLAAVRLYKMGMARKLYLSGAVWPAEVKGGAELSEPVAMCRVCLENGVRAEDITLDPVGDNTRATAFDAARFMKDRGFSTVAVCTDQYHLYRTVKSFREMGVEARTASAVAGEWRCAGVHTTAREMVANVVYWIRPGYHEARILPMKLKAARVVVRKAARILEIYEGGALLKKFACITGGNVGDKSVEGDRRTPVGLFHVVFKNPDSKFHLSLGLDYPTAEDAQRGLKSGLITQEQYDGIAAALKSDLSLKENQQKLWYTPLGGEIFIHGYAEGRTGTAGCVAVSNPDIEEIYAALEVGTPVEIRP